MPKAMRILTDTAAALALILLAVYSATVLALEAVNSPLYRQSRIVSMLVQQDTVGFSQLVSDRRNVDMVIKFAGALTVAYINFELIPVNEASSFVAVFESLPPDVYVDSFEYRRKDLRIIGSARDESGYETFLEGIRERGRFLSVSGGFYESEDGGIKFEITAFGQ